MKKKLRFVLLFFFFLVKSIGVFCSGDLYSIKKIGMEMGLSNNYILNITGDSTGFIWFGTDWGLNRFDGNKFEVFVHDPDDVNSIGDNGINKLLADNTRNKLWIATKRAGLNVFDPSAGCFLRYPIMSEEKNSVNAYGITDLCFDEDGDIWIATYGNGLKKLLADKDSVVHFEGIGIDGYIWSVADDTNGTLYIGHADSGLSILSLKDYSVKNIRYDVDKPSGLLSNTIFKVYIDSRGNVWLCTNNGLSLFDPETGRFFNFNYDYKVPHSLSSNHVFSILEINNKLWIGTANGINILDLDKIIQPGIAGVGFDYIGSNDLATGLSNGVVRDIFQDSFGNVWIGTNRAINFISHMQPFFNTIMYSAIRGDINSLSDRDASTVCYEEKNGLLWVGTEKGGVDVYHGTKKIAHYDEQNGGLPENYLLSSLVDSNGDVWFGTDSKGVVRFNRDKNRFDTVELPARREYCDPFPVNFLFEDMQGGLWIGGYNALFRYDLGSGKIDNYNGDRVMLPRNLFRSMGQDRNGNLWVGTLTDGLSIVTPDFKLVRNLLEINGVHHIYCDCNGGMWVSSINGVYYFPPDDDYSDYTVFRQDAGLEDVCVYAIIEDNPGEMWMSTNRGISFYSVKEQRFENYSQVNGIPYGSFKVGSVVKTDSGIIYFGSQNGVCFFDSRQKMKGYEVPPVVLTGFAFYDNHKKQSKALIGVPVSQTVRLGYKQNNFVIDFNIMDYSLSDRVEYSYSLQGVDDDLWYNINGQNQVVFRGLPPGKYLFKVKARLKHQLWPDDFTTMEIVVIPPFWLTQWAKFLYLLVSASIVYFIFRFHSERRNRLREQELNSEKLNFYTNVAHELKTPLTLIMGPLADLKEDKRLGTNYINRISMIHKNATRLYDLTNQIMEFRKTETQNRKLIVEKSDISILVKEVVLKYKELNQNEDLSVNLFVETGNWVIYYDPEVITIILDNLISNAIKYTPQGTVGVYIREVRKKEKKRIIEIEVRDTGVGMPENSEDSIFRRYYQLKGKHQASGTGIGLALVKNLISLHYAQISVKSRLNEGTSFSVQLDADCTYPEAEHIESSEPAIQKTAERLSLPSILVVEDNEEIRQYIRECFAGSYEIMEACNGKEGIETAVETIPDIIISDIMMPVMDGINLCKILKEDVRTCHIPIILLTVRDSVFDKIEGYSMGADSYITKPFNSGLVQSRVRNLLETREKVKEFLSGNMYKKIVNTDALCELDNQFIEKTTSLIEEYMESDQLSVMFLAEQHCLSYSSFSRKIKAITGMTANELIRKLKLRQAEKMLLTGKYSITEIAYRLGFNNMSHFREYFKAEFGNTPSRYLKSIKNNPT